MFSIGKKCPGQISVLLLLAAHTSCQMYNFNTENSFEFPFHISDCLFNIHLALSFICHIHCFQTLTRISHSQFQVSFRIPYFNKRNLTSNVIRQESNPGGILDISLSFTHRLQHIPMAFSYCPLITAQNVHLPLYLLPWPGSELHPLSRGLL